MANVSFLLNDYGDCGTIVVSGVSGEQLKMLGHHFIVTPMADVPTTGHTQPTFWLCHSDEPEDCNEKDCQYVREQLGLTG